MFGSRGPRSKPQPGARRPSGPTARTGGILETVVIERSPRVRAARVAGVPRPVKPRLVDLAADWLSTALALAQVQELPDAGALRARVLELKGRFERDANAGGFSAQDIEDAVFAMVALIDETILSGRGAARDAWIARPLQLELYGRQLAGEEFFERLDQLRREREARIEALEVYCCCLAFGFEGRLRMSPAQLPELIDAVQRDITAARGAGLSPLAPNAGRRNERVAQERRDMPWWLPPAVCVPALIVAWCLLWAIARIGAGAAADAVTRSLAGR